MSNKSDGGPAFPAVVTEYEPGGFNDAMGGEVSGRDVEVQHPGMTLRDYFAAKALVGLLMSTGNNTQSIALYMTSVETGQVYESIVAGRAYDMADAMIAAQ